MRMHTVLGARLFKRTSSLWDYMSAEVALNHHENWDGSGYPGRIDDIFSDRIYRARANRARRSPCPRAWSPSPTSTMHWSPSGPTRWAGVPSTRCGTSDTRRDEKFDPELVGMFLRMGDVLNAIARKYSY